MGYPFGKDIAYTFYPIADETSVALPAQTATLYLYATESRPSRSEVASSGANATANYSSTAVSANDTSIAFTITAADIPDPDQNSEKDRYTYWVVVKFILKASGQAQYELRALQMERVAGHHKALAVVSGDLTAIYPYATTYASSGEITNFITVATDEVRARLRSEGYEWAQVYRPDRLKNATAHLALTKLAVAQIQSGGDDFKALYDIWFKSYENFYNSLAFEYDQYKTKAPTTTATKGGYVFISR